MPGKVYQLVVTRSARKDLLALPSRINEQVERALDRLLARFNEGERPQDMQRLRGREQTHRVDSGEYRILVTLDESAALITIMRVRHRKDVYRHM